ncbi:MAG: indole-3-glycerol phosphate synthase TrpC [Deltaproteobacteria bacterium]|nr:indole-3-glycerol phosphate synthase TrpC [Deltaproteobacteria bacterium]MBW1819143.1 indole-3-glycerol phosphate synthase TrpC [Deltaproteobacteria bacterium]MBW2284551.1 indole-3-glycerol phosphate synthase TrpC [Deltaproteobacteria bacterium]
MHSKLAMILATKEKEVGRLRGLRLPEKRDAAIPSRRDFKAAISAPGKVRLIAEIKFCSPSAGLIRERKDPSKIAQVYEASGAAAISLLTDETFFKGSIADLPGTRAACNLPVLRKDFIISAVQLKESFLRGADAVLLIARILGRGKLKRLISICREMGMDALTEVHDENDLDMALACGADIIGINNRDLDTFTVNLETTQKLIKRIPHGHVVVSESGIDCGRHVAELGNAGVHAVLVGTAIMGSNDMAGKVRELAWSK